MNGFAPKNLRIIRSANKPSMKVKIISASAEILTNANITSLVLYQNESNLEKYLTSLLLFAYIKGMKKLWIGILVLVVIAGIGAYAGRHQLKSLLGGSSTTVMQPVPTTSAVSPTSMAPTSNIYMTKTDANKGIYMTDFAGMSVYTFDKDTAGSGTSACYSACAKLWPPYTSGATAQGTFPANVTVITRTDGTKQFAWKGMPLYHYASDSKVGDLLGDGIGSVWHIVKM